MPVTSKENTGFDPSKYGAVEVPVKQDIGFDPTRYGAVEVKKKDGGSNLEVDAKGQLKSSVPTTSPSQPVPDFGMKSFADLAKGQQNVAENTSSNSTSDFEAAQQERATREQRAADRLAYQEKIKKAVPDALTNTAKNSLKQKGINPDANAAQLNQEKAKYATELETGNAEVGFDKDGKPGLIQKTGFLDSFHDHMMAAIQANKDAREFKDMTIAQRVAFANKVQPKEETPYIGSKPTSFGSVGAKAGDVTPTLGLYGAGAMAGGVLESLAPETGGLSNVALKPVMSFVMNAGLSADQKGMQGTLGRYSLIKKHNPTMTDEQAMEAASKGEYVDRLAGITEAALFSKTGGELGKTATKGLLKGIIKSGVDVGGKTAITEGVKDIGHNIEGVTDKSASDIAKDMANAFAENAPVGAVLHGFMGALTGISKVPELLKSGLKYDVVTKMNPVEVGSEIDKNVNDGAITPEQGDKAKSDLDQFGTVVNKVPIGLSDESKAAAAGLIIKRDNLKKQAEGKDESAKDIFNTQVESINNQIKDIYRTDKPLEHEVNEATGETYKKPTFDNIAAMRVKNLADKISKGKEITDPEDIQTEHNFPDELEKNLNRITREEKSGNKDKENPNTELSDNVEKYLNDKSKEAEKTKVPIPAEKASVTDEGIDKNIQPTETGTQKEEPAQSIIIPETKTESNGSKINDGSSIKEGQENTSGQSTGGTPTEQNTIAPKETTGEGEEEDVTSIKNEVTRAKRKELGLEEEIPAAKKEFGTTWEEAKDKIENGYHVQDLVDELKKKPRPLTDVENAMLLHHQNTKEIQLMDANKQINEAAEKGNESDVLESKVRKARLLDELQDVYDVDKAVGTENARGLSSRKMMVDRKYSLTNMIAEKRATVNDGKPLSEEQMKDVEKLHAKIKETQEAFDEYVKQAQADIKSLQEKILGKKVANKKSAASKLREWADKIDEKTKGVAVASIVPITPKMISGAMRLIADGLDKGGEILDLVKKAIEGIRKENPDIDEAVLYQKINKEVIDSGIISPTKDNKNLKDYSGLLDRKLLKLRAENQRAKDNADIAIKKDEAQKRTLTQKVQDTFVKWQRAFKLTNPVTMGKLLAAATTRGITTPLEDVVGGVYSELLPKLAKGAIGEGGGLNVKETAKAYKEGMVEGMKDAYQIMKKGGHGKSDIDVIFGKSGQLPPEAIDFFGQLHSATKAPIKRIIFERQLEKRFRRSIKNGIDVSDPMVQSEIAIGAYKDALRAIFMQDNKVAEGWQKMVNYLEKTDPKTGKTNSKLTATALQWLVPFVKVPTNIAAEIGTNVYGVPVAAAKIIHSVFTKGLESLPSDEKDIILRNLKKGSLGLAALSYGYFNPQTFGGYYQEKEKRNPNDAKAGAVKIGDINIPAWLIESPIFQAMQVGATVRRVKDAKVKGQEKGISEGVWAGALGLADHVPLIDQPLRIAKSISDPKERQWYLGELAKGTVIPAIVQKAAEFTDDGKKRNPSTIGEHLEMGIPGLRENVPERSKRHKPR